MAGLQDTEDGHQIGSGDPFPLKLHFLLEDTEKRGFTSIVCWEGERAFQVHNKELFAEIVMPIYFDSTNYKTFQRNLNLWGFRTISKGPRKGECSHALFVRGQPDLCRTMVRVRNKTNPPERFYQQGTAAGSDGDSSNVAPPPSPPTTFSATELGANANLGASFLQAQPANSNFSFSGSHDLAPALANLLRNFVSSANSQPEQPLPHPVFSTNQSSVNHQMLQLLALQQQSNMSSSGLSVPTFNLNSSFQASWPCQTVQNAPPVQAAIPANTLSLASSFKGIHGNSDSAENIVEEAKKEQEIARENGTRIVACRARGMPMNHNIHVSTRKGERSHDCACKVSSEQPAFQTAMMI
jgi:hypothetical protein